MRNPSYILLALFFLTGFSNSQNLSGAYFLFKSKYRLGSYYHLDTKTLTEELFANANSLTLIDSIYLLPLNLVDTTKNDKERGVERLSDYDCRLISLIENKKYDCVVTISYTSTAGNGDPIILVNTYNKIGKLISQAKFDLVGQHDYSPVPKQYFSINKKNIISMELISKNYEIVDSLGIEILKYIDTDYYNENYSINRNGVILKQKE
ncbi:MAG: hypothetical protein Q8S18_08920 [Bacteroidales bacterium]|nr:hypothetical protein [Bacteroidales bacterium]